MNLKSGKNGGIRMFPKSRQFFAIHGNCASPYKVLDTGMSQKRDLVDNVG